MSEEMDIPSEILEDLQSFHENLKKMEETLNPLIKTNVNSLDVKLLPLDRARLNLISGYALNSLYWMYLNTLGEDPKHHKIKRELERYKSFMQTVKEITDKDKAPVLDKGAAKRFLRNALWEPSGDQSSNKTRNLPCTVNNSYDTVVTVKKEPDTNTNNSYKTNAMQTNSASFNINQGTCVKQEARVNFQGSSATVYLPHTSKAPCSSNLGIEEDEDYSHQAIELPTTGRKFIKAKRSIKRHTQKTIIAEEVVYDLSCGLCFVPAMQLKQRKSFPVFLLSCGHFYCGPCIWGWRDGASGSQSSSPSQVVGDEVEKAQRKPRDGHKNKRRRR
ncbi:hypothetical protein JTE90_019333 [Oedothorax gibbosus]|uniref:Nuclear nucleic acid-binding protein C1D n=1 Tax=Oedothorax gibbosus TaxID=931172 RepID=A0AAV6UKJ3_9ARAC|nr:hypothetical protein JTE90_019333 [Oedothorax gibbosus]